PPACPTLHSFPTRRSSDLGNSAQVIYTTSGQTTKGICILGYLDFSSGEATAGTWATAPDKIQVFKPGTPLPGDIVQTQRNVTGADRKSTRLNSSHSQISYA